MPATGGRRWIACAAAVVGVVLLLTTLAVAAGRHARVSGLYNARYCEVIELHGLPPHGSASVWNTIGSNRCPESLWRALDAGTIARQDRATAVVLNGPRYFLMDSTTAVVGGHRVFGGLRTTLAATIPIRTAADLAQTPYTDRTIDRDNEWRWRTGRTLYELVAPGGDVYVMQSYAQIVDPGLTLADLAGLGRRLHPPQGWRYRTVRLRKPFSLGVRRTATVVQDDLKDTYQLATAPPSGPRRDHPVRLTGHTHTVHPSTPETVEDHGTLSGTPFGSGTVVLVGKLAGGRLTGSYRLTFARGSVRGDLDLPFTISGGMIHFRGTSHFTAGTGVYRGIASGALQVTDHNTLDGQHGVLSVSGNASYPS